MAQRGRKSTAALTAVTRIPGQRMPPPAELTAEQAEEWKAVVSTKPPEWFNRDCQALLVEYCRHVVMCRAIAGQVDSYPMDMLTTEEGIDRFEQLSRLMDRHTKAVAMLSVKMRLAPQSRYEAKVAGTAGKNANSGSGAARPWEVAANG